MIQKQYAKVDVLFVNQPSPDKHINIIDINRTGKRRNCKISGQTVLQ